MNPMCVEGTPVEHHPELGLYVKREDLSCSGPPFSKTRGVYAHVKARPERIIGVLDTSHSQGGWAVARACSLLDKKCVLYYPVRKAEHNAPTVAGETYGEKYGNRISPQQVEAANLGAKLVALQAGRSAVLYHEAKKHLSSLEMGEIARAGAPLAQRSDNPTYMMPNALKLPEMITETVAEVARTTLPPVDVQIAIVSASSGTIAGGVWRGLYEAGWCGTLIIHQGYSRPRQSIESYMLKMVGWSRPPLDGEIDLVFVDEGYAYGDATRKDMPALPFPSNTFYDRKAVDWWLREGQARYPGQEALLWNIG